MPLTDLLDFILHIDKYLAGLIQQYGTGVYALIFLIVFLETGLVVTPFLPGDSLLFASGAFAAQGAFNVGILAALLTIAAILGDSLNYRIGKTLGDRVFKEDIRFVNKHYLEHAQKFYEKHGAKTIVLARFVPIVRTFAPFLAGVSSMHYATFITYNVIGAIAWVALFVFGGYLFGNLPIVQDNFGTVTIVIIVLSFIPVVWELWKHRRSRRDAPSRQE